MVQREFLISDQRSGIRDQYKANVSGNESGNGEWQAWHVKQTNGGVICQVSIGHGQLIPDT